MALKTPYATATEADSYLVLKEDWLDLDTDVKEAHLLNATYYLDSHYVCSFSDVIEDEAAYACSLLAYHDFTDGLYVVDSTNGGVITEKEVEAGSVRSKTRYAGGMSSGAIGSIDPFPIVTATLTGLCYLKKPNGLSQVGITRT